MEALDRRRKQASTETVQLEIRWVDVNGLPIFARVSRDEPAFESPEVVLVNGLVISSRYMVPTIKLLGQSYRVFSPDLPGFGNSSKPDHVLSIQELTDALVAWMDAMHLERPVLIGHSFGCQVLVDLGMRYPGRAEALVLAAPSVDAHARSATREIARGLVDSIRERTSLKFLELRDVFRAGLYRSWKTFRYALADPIENKLEHVKAPTLVIRGELDTIVPHEWAVEVTRRLPDAQLQTLPHAPHTVNYTTPEPFVDLLREFLDPLAQRQAKNRPRSERQQRAL